MFDVAYALFVKHSCMRFFVQNVLIELVPRGEVIPESVSPSNDPYFDDPRNIEAILNLQTTQSKGLAKLKKSEPAAYKKANNLLFELIDHPDTGTGKPERLKGNLTGKWSRKITDKLTTYL